MIWTLTAMAALAAMLAGIGLWMWLRRPDAYIYVPENMAYAQFRYQDLPMRECAFCSRGVNLNRHHVVPQLAAPEERDNPANLIVLCRSCHQVVGHKNNWKKFNPHVRDICEKYGGPPVDSKEWRTMNGKQG